MRNLLIAVLIICALLVAGFYLFFPSRITVTKVIFIKTNLSVASRFFLDSNSWGKWFPRDNPIDTSFNDLTKEKYEYKDCFYSMEKRMMNTAEISISNKQVLLKSLISIFSINNDSIAIQWKSDTLQSSNPFIRIRNYIRAREIQNNMEDILAHLKVFLGENKNIYGIYLHTIISKDSTLIVIKDTSTTYPSTAIIYNLVLTLKKYALENGALENNFPMLNIRKSNDNTFEIMVAIPINKYLEGKGKILNKRFVPWKVLTAEVKGGDYTVNEAFKQMLLYMSDNQIKGMALPFASLVTERNMQPDTSKWVTRIYTPIP